MSGKKIITGLQDAIAMTDRNELVARLQSDVKAHEITHNGNMKRVVAVREAIARIEADAATIARLEGEIADLTHDLERIKDSETAYLNAFMQAEAKLSAIRALQAAPEGWDEVMATRALVMAKDAAEVQVAELKQEAGMFLALWAVRHAEMQGLADGEIHPQHYDRMAELGCRMDAFTRAAIAAAKEGA